MTVSTAVRSPHRLRRGSLAALAAAVAVAGGITAIVTVGDDAESGSSSKAAVLSMLTPEERRYVEWVSSAPPEQVAAAFGTYGVQKTQPPLHPGANVR